MGTGQMLLVLLTVVLFTSIMGSTMANLTNQMDYVFQTMIILQGEKIVNKYINLIDVLLFSQQQTFADIYSDYQSFSYTETAEGIETLDYNVNITMQYCTDETGNTVAGAPTEYLRIRVWVSVDYGGETLNIGTASAPIYSVYTERVL
jgi:hypothetical protein